MIAEQLLVECSWYVKYITFNKENSGIPWYPHITNATTNPANIIDMKVEPNHIEPKTNNTVPN